jgi:hypothetical protein
MLQSLSSDDNQLLALLDRLADTAKRAGPHLKADLAALQLDVIERLSKSAAALSDQQKQELDRLRAAALAQLGRREEALAAYAALAKAQPNSGAVQEAYADLLSESSDKESLTAALSRWRQIAARSEPRGERWCKAKYQVAALQCKLGDSAAAATLCRYLLETPPGLSETGWQERFEKLLAECRP